jgi:hypothetical protein
LINFVLNLLFISFILLVNNLKFYQIYHVINNISALHFSFIIFHFPFSIFQIIVTVDPWPLLAVLGAVAVLAALFVGAASSDVSKAFFWYRTPFLWMTVSVVSKRKEVEKEGEKKQKKETKEEKYNIDIRHHVMMRFLPNVVLF